MKGLLAGIGLLALLVSTTYIKEEALVDNESMGYPSASHQSFYDLPSFYEGIEQEGYVDKISNPVYGGIVSHHLLTRKSIAQFFAEFRSQPVETVVLIGPNHYSVGAPKASITLKDFDTPYGIISVDSAVASSLIESGLVALEEKPFRNEHSISALTPYIKYNFPEAKIVPIVLHYSTSRIQLDGLVEQLLQSLPKNSIVVASVDFSHHLNRIATEFHDVSSVSAIEQFDFDRIFNLEIDSPPSIYTVLSYMSEVGAQNISHESLNSTDFTGNLGTEDATSYVFAHFSDGMLQETPTEATSLHFGDMMFDRAIKEEMTKGEDPFEYIKGVEGNFLRGVDVTVGNLEGVISDAEDCQEEKEVVMQFDSSAAGLLEKYNFSAMNLANNHSNDCFEQGLLDTEKILSEKSIDVIGSELSDGYIVKDVGTKSIAIVGVNEVSRFEDDFHETLDLIETLSKEHDSMVVHVHWGYEYDTKASSLQKEVAYQLVDAGAEVIIGHHPHVIQEVEQYNGSTIFYSLGNFIFDQTHASTTVGFGVGLVHSEGVQNGVVFPYTVEGLKPKLMPYEDMKVFCDDFLQEISREGECGFVQ